MMFKRITKGILPTIILIAASCVDSYEPPVSSKEVSFLVVDGFLNSGGNSIQVKLSRAVPLADNTLGNVVNDASVQLEAEDGTNTNVPSLGNGVYSAAGIDATIGKKYRLRVKSGASEYLSDLIELKRSPALDSVTWRGGEKGVTIYVDSHDVTGGTKYYQWVFSETWEYHAQRFSDFKWEKGVMIQRRAGDYINECYKSEESTKVLITATVQNSQDVVNDFPLTVIPIGSAKVSVLYSILVQQRALDEPAYVYWKNLQKTTENLGGLFDPLPSEVTGNIRNINNPSEKVLGYFTGGEVQEKRLFIRYTELPANLRVVDQIDCPNDSILVGDLGLYRNSSLTIAGSWGAPATIGYISVSSVCGDCRARGGLLQKPSFWPEF